MNTPKSYQKDQATKKSLSFEEALVHPDHESHRELIQYLIDNKGKNLFPRKDLAEQKRVCAHKMEKIMEENPGALFKDVLAQLLINLPSDYPVEMIVPLTEHLTLHWVKKYSKELVA